MRRLTPLLIVALATALPAQQKPAVTLQLPPRPLLPTSFAGWTAVSAPVEADHPLSISSAERSDQLKEIGFKRQAIANYQKGFSKIEVMAFQFEDATGAYAEFAGNSDDNYSEEMFNDITGIHGQSILRSGDSVLEVGFGGTPPPHLREDLQALAKTLPIPFGSKGEPPSLLEYLPKSNLSPQSVRYVLGPIGFASKAPYNPLTGKLDFNTGAEVVVGQYGSGTLTLIEYPTPQMAIAQLQSIATMLQLAPQKDLPDGLLGNSTEVAWRTGPLVALTSGMPQAQAVKLAHEVHYESSITWNHPEGYVSDAWRAAHLYLGIFALAGILCGASIILGLFFGGARAISRVLRGKSASSVQDIKFISLDLGTGGELQRMEAERRRNLQK
jgi:hypothetical protein